MQINFPAQVFSQSFFQRISGQTPVHGHMMFKTVLAHVAEKSLKVIHMAESHPAGGINLIIPEITLSHIGFDGSLHIIGGYSQKSHGAGLDLGFQSAEMARRLSMVREMLDHATPGSPPARSGFHGCEASF